MRSTGVSTSRCRQATCCTVFRCPVNAEARQTDLRQGRQMNSRFRRVWRLLVVVALSITAAEASQQNPFVGRWNLTGTGSSVGWVGWLEITQEGGQLTGQFLNRGGAPSKLASAGLESGALVFQGAARRGGAGPLGRGRMQAGQLHLTITSPATANTPERVIEVTGVHPPEFPASDADAPHTFGRPIELFDGTSLDAFTLANPDRPWTVAGGLATNSPPGDPASGRAARGSNLISKQKFQHYRIHPEY